MRPQLAASVIAYQIFQDWVREGEAERLSSSVRAPRTTRRHTGSLEDHEKKGESR